MTALVGVHRLRLVDDDGQELVKDVSFEVGRGERFGIVGESGSGKTLTCRALLGALPRGIRIASGDLVFDGTPLVDASERTWRTFWGRRMGAVFQDPATYLNPSIPVGRQVEESLRVVGGLTRAQSRARSIELLASVGLRDPERVAKQYVRELSGGMLQRILIAIAVSNGPELLVADEATTALDVTVQAEVLDLLDRLHEESRLTTIVVSHDLAVIARMCDRIAVFKDGEIVEEGVTRTVLNSPQHPYTRQLVDSHERFGMERLRATEGSR